MKPNQVELRSTVSTDTKRRLEAFADAYQLDKNAIIEEAIRVFMDQHEDVPDGTIPLDGVLTNYGFGEMLERLNELEDKRS